MYLLSQTVEQYTMLPLLLGWKANTKKAPAGQSRGSNALSQQHGFCCVTQYHNSMVRKCSVLYDFFIKRLPMLHAQAAQKSNI